MSTKSKRNVTTKDEKKFGWDAMIRDARKKMEDLKFSIEVFEKKKASGIPWPGVQESDRRSKANG